MPLTLPDVTRNTRLEDDIRLYRLHTIDLRVPMGGWIATELESEQCLIRDMLLLPLLDYLRYVTWEGRQTRIR